MASNGLARGYPARQTKVCTPLGKAARAGTKLASNLFVFVLLYVAVSVVVVVVFAAVVGAVVVVVAVVDVVVAVVCCCCCCDFGCCFCHSLGLLPQLLLQPILQRLLFRGGSSSYFCNMMIQNSKKSHCVSRL